jgi:hypothetical protein
MVHMLAVALWLVVPVGILVFAVVIIPVFLRRMVPGAAFAFGRWTFGRWTFGRWAFGRSAILAAHVAVLATILAVHLAILTAVLTSGAAMLAVLTSFRLTMECMFCVLITAFRAAILATVVTVLAIPGCAVVVTISLVSVRAVVVTVIFGSICPAGDYLPFAAMFITRRVVGPRCIGFCVPLGNFLGAGIGGRVALPAGVLFGHTATALVVVLFFVVLFAATALVVVLFFVVLFAATALVVVLFFMVLFAATALVVVLFFMVLFAAAALIVVLLVDRVSCHLFSKHFWLLSPRNPRDENHM